MFFRTILATVLTAFALSAAAAVDANKANQAELETVKGIGPALSTKILDARKSGEFKTWGDLVDRVGGVGPGNAARFSQAGLTVGGSAYERTAAAAKDAKPVKESRARRSKADEARQPRS